MTTVSEVSSGALVVRGEDVEKGRFTKSPNPYSFVPSGLVRLRDESPTKTDPPHPTLDTYPGRLLGIIGDLLDGASILGSYVTQFLGS